MDRCERFCVGTRMADYIAARYGAVLLHELSDVQLQHAYRMVARWAIEAQTSFKDALPRGSISQIK